MQWDLKMYIMELVCTLMYLAQCIHVQVSWVLPMLDYILEIFTMTCKGAVVGAFFSRALRIWTFQVFQNDHGHCCKSKATSAPLRASSGVISADMGCVGSPSMREMHGSQRHRNQFLWKLLLDCPRAETSMSY